MLATLPRRPGGTLVSIGHDDADRFAVRNECPTITGGRILRQPKLYHLTDRQIDSLSWIF